MYLLYIQNTYKSKNNYYFGYAPQSLRVCLYIIIYNIAVYIIKHDMKSLYNILNFIIIHDPATCYLVGIIKGKKSPSNDVYKFLLVDIWYILYIPTPRHYRIPNLTFPPIITNSIRN